MVLDQIFGQQHQLDGLCLSDEPLLTDDLLPSGKDLAAASMDLDDFHFDFDDLSDDTLGSWIQTDDFLDIESDKAGSGAGAADFNFSDLEITEAVRYDCMWSTPTVVPPPTATAPQKISPPQLFSLNTGVKSSPDTFAHLGLNDSNLLEEFLKLVEPSSTTINGSGDNINNVQHDVNVKKEEPEPIVKEEVFSDSSLNDDVNDDDSDASSTMMEDQLVTSSDHLADSNLAETISQQVRMFTSMDHCYFSRAADLDSSLSSTRASSSRRSNSRRQTVVVKEEPGQVVGVVPSHRHNYSIDTPPESSEDEENVQSSVINTRIYHQAYNNNNNNNILKTRAHSTSAAVVSSSSSATRRRVIDPRLAHSLLKSLPAAAGLNNRNAINNNSSGAKFSFRVKLKSADKSRSVLKQRVVNCNNATDLIDCKSLPSSPLRGATTLLSSTPSSSSLSGHSNKYITVGSINGGRNSSVKSFSSSSSISNKFDLSAITSAHSITTSSSSSLKKRKEATNATASLKPKHEEAREIHNQMERQRRNELKVAFDELKAYIPEISGSDKVSKQMILDKAVESCRLLKSREITMRIKKEKMRRSQLLLRERVKQLQAANINNLKRGGR